MSEQRKTFAGGYRFTRFDAQPAAVLVEPGTPERIVVLLKQGFRDAVAPVVEAGETVAAGQIVGRDDSGISSPVHSSVTGVVEEVRDPGGDEAGAIVIRREGSGPVQRLPGHSPDWRNLPAETCEDLLYLSGVTALGGGGIPTRHRSAAIAPEAVETVIVHDAGSEMYHPSLRLLLDGDNVRHFADGLRILKRVLSGAMFHVAIDERESALCRDLATALADCDWVEFHALRPKYPQDFDEVLVPTLLDRGFPHGHAADTIGVVTLACQAVLHAYEAVALGKPLIERVVALAGGGFRQPAHARVLLGTPLEDVLRETAPDRDGLRFIRNSTLTGERLSDLSAPVDRTFSSIIAIPEHGPRTPAPFVRPGFRDDAYSRTFLSCLLPTKKRADASLKGEARPCVSCGYCQNVCPVGIVPHLLYKYVSRELIEDDLVDLKIFNCIGCNLCSYVCPSKIAVGKYIRLGQAKLREEGVEPI